MNAQRAAVSTDPSGVSAGLPVAWSFLPRAADLPGAGCRGCAVAGSAPAANITDASRADRRVSIANRLLFHNNPRIGYSCAEHLVQYDVGLLHAGERSDDDPMRLHASLARAGDVRADAGCPRALDVGIFEGLERTESHEQAARIGRSPGHRLRQTQVRRWDRFG